MSINTLSHKGSLGKALHTDLQLLCDIDSTGYNTKDVESAASP